ncbi:nitroreductase family protein [Pseudomonas veronii]|jgi:nitroreductase|uniref:Nitroreductase n=1 Tax=Pseudomonas veronii TaxID=76761 RepID=A0A0R3B6Y6_PSEVE|nr:MULTISPECIES: nitroreductase [Pseudomonas]SEC41719.1 Nitroreductase [Pseudomonas marginalis]AQY66344.1 nitroreductase [Pseudomonas veronii]KRP81093.1 nitroreductase [Pseudomonas veronii]MCT8960779.1 nitroreductase [Pseudomonas veronii]MCT9823711.1 nitroreductase [Pseudomonas veronii]
MNVTKAIAGRRSTRDYTPEPLDEKLICRLIDAAAQAPSAMNQQPWTFTVIRDQALLERVSREARAWMLATTPAGTHSSHFQALLSEDSFQIFYHAPVLVLISGNAPNQWIVEDCALAAENLMLAAYAEGLGTCWIGFAQGFLNTPQGKQALGLPAEWMPVAPIIVGHPKSVPAPIVHKTPEIHWIG